MLGSWAQRGRRMGRGARLAVAGWLISGALAAATRVVDTLADVPVAGTTTLRQAIAASVDGDTIEFSGGLFAGGTPRTLELGSALVVAKRVTIVGPGDAAMSPVPLLQIAPKAGVVPSFRLLQIAPAATAGPVVVAGLGFAGGKDAGGGAVLVESGASALFQGCDFVNNEATGTNSGGAILNRGTLTLDRCLVRLNRAPGGNGGGVASPGRLSVVRSLFDSNTAGGFGGGLYVGAADFGVESSTVAGNTSGAGGAIAFVAATRTLFTATLNALTIADNTAAAQTGGLYVEGGGAVANLGNSILTRNFIVNNSGAKTPHDLGTQKSGKINSTNYNIVGKPGTTLSPYCDDDQVSVDPKLGPLAYNGGRTRTYAIGLGSPALNRGNPTFTGILSTTDQRGLPRVWQAAAGGRVDVGAFEFNPSLLCPGDRVVEATAALTPVTLNAFLTLPRGGAVTVTWTVGGVAGAATALTVPDSPAPLELVKTVSLPLGVTPVSVTVSLGTTALSCSARITVADSIPPTITVLGANPAYLEFGRTYVDAGATAFDLRDGALPVTVDVSQVNVTALGMYLVTYRAVDAAGNPATATRTVIVRDTTPPVLTLSPTFVVLTNRDPATCSYLATLASLGLSLQAVDVCDPAPAFVFEIETGGVLTPVTFPYAFPQGASTLLVSARDASGNRSLRQSVGITVRDGVPPVVTLLGNATVSLALGAVFDDPGVDATDRCSGPVTVVRTISVGGVAKPSLETCAPGSYLLTYTATDAAGNSTVVTRTVTVTAAVSLSATTPVSRTIDPATRLAAVNLAQVVSLSGLNAGCAGSLAYTVVVTPPTGAPVTLAGLPGAPLPVYAFAVGTSGVEVRASLRGADGAAVVVATTTLQVVATDPFGVTLGNVVWPLAIDFAPKLVPTGGKLVGTTRQMIARAGESRWYKFKVAPGSKVDITLTGLPANFDVVVYSDIRQVYNQLLGLTGPLATATDKKVALLGAEFAPEAYSPEAYSPEAYSPEAYSPEAYSPEAYSPEAYSPEAYSPVTAAPEAYSPEAYSPEAYSPEAYSPEAYSPEAYSPEAYASAQQRSLVGFAAAPGTVSEGIRFSTYARSGEFYVRVRGQNGVYATTAPFTLGISLQQNVCAGITDFNTTPVLSAPAVAGAPTSLIVWDSRRISGNATELAALASALSRLATAANGLVLDVSLDPQIVRLNAQADANPDCPAGKNLVADAIRNLIQIYRKALPSLADVTLVGNDAAIPFFRSNDQALLASEANYFPPVKDGTPSQAGLRYAQVLSQDRYGSSLQVVLATGPYDLPEMPVGRLVETAAEVQAYVDTYVGLFNGTATSGTVPTPTSALVAGYDFLADSAFALRDEFTAGLAAGARIDSLISPADQPPSLGWTADQLRAQLLGSRHDLGYLAGHFSTGRALAADFTTRVRAQEVADSAVNLAYALFLSAGCHSGFSTVDNDAVPLVTESPDWAQAFSRKRAMWIAGTGYQYGDTDFIEYTERLLREVARALRTGTGPVSVGRALVDAKRRYLAETSIMRGIHEKTLLEVTLYGLPMVKINLPGARLTRATAGGDIPLVTGIGSGPGVAHGLKQADLTFNPTLTRVNRILDVVGTATTVTASYFTGSDGIVSLPGEPVRALEAFNVSRPEGFVRGVGFRGGVYHDIGGFVPFTGAPTTETRGVHGRFLSEVFYPSRPWNVNQVGEVSDANGISVLNVFPTQFVSDGPGAAAGTLRAFDQMQFTLFYSADTSNSALANPPAINVVGSTLAGGVATFSADVAATTGAGVHEVWVTYTGLPGSPYYGAWRSLTLTGPANATGIGTWTGALTLPSGADPALVRFVVQAANGVGGVTLNSNFGRFFKLGASTLDGVNVVGAPTTLALVAPVPTGGVYRAQVPVAAVLLDGAGLPLAGKRIQFRVGPIAVNAFTDAAGKAAASLQLAVNPGAYVLEATFGGEAGYQNSTAVAPVTVTKMPAALTFEGASVVPDASGFAVRLLSSDGTPLKERTVVFVSDNGTSKTAVAEITDGTGIARLPSTALAPGSYQVTATFGQPVLLPDGTQVPLNDPLYGGAVATRSVTITGSLRFSRVQAWLTYADRSVAGATTSNQGLSKAELLGSVAGPTAQFNPTSILATPKSTTVSAQVRAWLAGKTVAAGTVTLRVLTDDDDAHWRGEAVIDGATIQVYVDWDDEDHKAGKYHVWITPRAGTGPLYTATPAVFELELVLGAGAGEHPAGGLVVVGGTENPWTKQTPGSRVRSN